MDTAQPVAIYSTNNPVEAQVLRNALEEEGIQAVVDSTTAGGLVGIQTIHLLVHAADAERARAIVMAHDERRASEPDEDEDEEAEA